MKLHHLFTRSSSKASKKKCRLQLQSLEDRAVPATALFNAGTLTITANENETITISSLPGQSSGFLNVSDGNPNAIFNSSQGNQVVKNVVVRFDNVSNGTLNVLDGVGVSGDIKVFGGTGSTAINLHDQVSIGRDLIVKGKVDSGNETIKTGSELSIGRNASFLLGGGSNHVTFEGGTVNGRLTVKGGSGSDTISLAKDGTATSFSVGSANFSLGNGVNVFESDGTLEMNVQKGLTYSGGINADTIDFHSASENTVLNVGGHLKLWMKNSIGGTNTIEFDKLSVNKSVFVTAGSGDDNILFYNTGNVGGILDAKLGAGKNTLEMGYYLKEFVVGKDLRYTGGSGDDYVSVGTTRIGRNLSVRLGQAAGHEQKLLVGNAEATQNILGELIRPPVTVAGNARIVGGLGSDHVQLDYFTVQGRLYISLGKGDDELISSSAEVSRLTAIYLGTGNDKVVLDPVTSSLVNQIITEKGISITAIQSLLLEIVELGLTSDIVNGLLEQLILLDLDISDLTGALGSILSLDLGSDNLSELLTRLASDNILDAIARITDLGLSGTTLSEILHDVLTLDAAGLITDLTTFLLGSGYNLVQVGQLLPDLTALLTNTDLLGLLQFGEGLNLDTTILGNLLESLGNLELTNLELGGLLGEIKLLNLGTLQLNQLLTSLVVFNIVDLSSILTLVINESTNSRYAKFVLYGHAGEDNVTLGQEPGKVQFTAPVRLYGGSDIDTLSVNRLNTYTAANNGKTAAFFENFENGSF